MEQPAAPADAAEANGAPATWRQRLVQRASRAATWACATRLRMAIGGVAGLLLLGCMFAVWSYMGHLAVEAIEPVTLEMALEALDAERFQEALAIIGEMQEAPASPELLGGALFVLGAAKAHEAEQEESPERQRSLYQLAARYLTKARSMELPPGRESQAAYLLGKSCVRGGRARQGIASLQEALDGQSLPAVEIHSLLAQALLDAPDPDWAAALKHNEFVLADASLPEPAQREAWLARAEALLRMRLPAEAKAAASRTPAKGSHAALRALLLGRVEVLEAEELDHDPGARDAKIADAIGTLRNAQRLDQGASRVTRQAMYWVGRCHELKGDDEAAIAQYDRLIKVFGETPEGLAGQLAESDCFHRAGSVERALAGYRSVLQGVSDPLSYDNPLLSLAELKRRLTKVYQQFVRDEFFSEGLALVDLFEPVFGRQACVEMRAQTHQSWGAKLIAQAQGEDRKQQVELQKRGRAHLRAAGRAFEDLAELRPASRAYTNDLWLAGENYFDGHSFSGAARLFEKYLRHEARRRNSLALLRLGQARLAEGEFEQAAHAFDECIELYPRDAVAYQARLECARAHQQLGEFEAAEQMLRTNLWSEGLTPNSPEWRDSKFALGRLYYDSERYDEAIATLDEAVQRYPQDDAALMARYTIARAYHNASELPAERQRTAASENERQKNRKLAAHYLELAHSTYQDVQRTITLKGHSEDDPLQRALLRNCYMMQGSALFELRRFEEARQAYGNVITLYQNDPIVLESFVQVANCWRRLAQPQKARVTLDQAKMVLERLPKDVNFLASTNFNRQQWELLLSQMSKW